MAIDKAIEYKMQGGKKPARNYLGKQKTVSNIPVKWKSGPDAPSTELAYITKAEKDLILKKNLHGSLKNGPNTGPDGIMSLDSQGDYTRDRSRDKARSQMSRRDSEAAVRQEAERKKVLTGQVNRGQTVKTGPKTRKYAVPEYVNVKQKDGTYKNKYVGSGYKSYGQPSFFGNLFSIGAPGYRGIKGMPAFWGKPGFETRGVPGQKGFGYYSDNENFGDTRDPVPLGIMGLIANAINKFKKPKDMSEFNKLGLGGTHPAALDFDPNAKIQETAFSKTLSDPFKYGVGPVPPSDKYKYSDGPRAVNNDAVSLVTPETGFFENQFNKFFSGPEFDAYNAVRTDKYANAPSKFDYDFNTNKAAMQMINDKITNNAKGTIFRGLPSELASVVGNIAAVPASIPASLGHEFVQSRKRVQDQFKGASPSIMAEGPSIGDYYSGFMDENPFVTAGTRALGIGAALPDALKKVYNSLGFADGGLV